MIKEKISKHLGVPYIYLPEHKKFLCENGVIFTKEEYDRGIDINKEYEIRSKNGGLYDYVLAKNTGILRKKMVYAKDEEITQDNNIKNVEAENTDEKVKENETKRLWVQSGNDRRISSVPKSILGIILLLGFTSVISMYISTLHTATYLVDYVDLVSAWLMSASVTAYNATAFEVSVLFKSGRRYFMSVVFMFLWILVTAFSMATTVSVFYDQFNFQEAQITEENKKVDSNKLALELLQRKEKDLRDAIEFKKKDIEYRQEKDYATTAVRNELTDLQNELQVNLTEQENLLKDTPEVTEEKVQRKESLFSFLGRLLHVEGAVLEFIMSTLSAIFVNLIAPLSLTAVIELKRKEEI